MARILAVEPDHAQAAVLVRVIRQTGAEPVMADSKEAAIAALDSMAPDLILVSALLSPRDELELGDHFRREGGVDHVQILTIPLLATGEPSEPVEPAGGLLSAFRRKRKAPAAPRGCDPDRYGDELKGYLKLAIESQAERRRSEARPSTRVESGREASLGPGGPDEARPLGAHEASPFIAFGAQASEENPETGLKATDEAPAVTRVEGLAPVAEPPFELTAPPWIPESDTGSVLTVEETDSSPVDDAPRLDFDSLPDDVSEASQPDGTTGEAPSFDARAVIETRDLTNALETHADERLTPLAPLAPETPSEAARPGSRQEEGFGLPAPPALAGFELDFASGDLDEAADSVPQAAPVDDDRFSLSSASFDIDRREADDFLLAAAREADPRTSAVQAATATTDPVAPLAPPAPRASSEAARLAPRTPSDAGGFDQPAPLAPLPIPTVEIWQALPDWVENWPPLEAHVEAAPVRPGVGSAPSPAAPAAVPSLDAGWIADALDALRSDIQQLRAEASEPRRIGAVPAAPLPAPAATAPAGPPESAPRPTARAVPPPAPGITPAPSLSRAVAASAPPVETSRPKKRKARKTKPVEDEWGIFDPRRAGVEALIAALEAKEQEESEEDSEEDGPSPPAALPTPERRLAPLSRWALSDSGSPEPTTQPRPTDDLRALLDGLAVPAHVASVSYPTGCRIRRVRMSKDPEHRNKKAADEPVIILSRRALGRSVPEKDDTGPLTSR